MDLNRRKGRKPKMVQRQVMDQRLMMKAPKLVMVRRLTMLLAVVRWEVAIPPKAYSRWSQGAAMCDQSLGTALVTFNKWFI